MVKKFKKLLVTILVIAMVVTVMPTTGTMAAKKKVPKLSKTKVTVYVGKTVKLQVKNYKGKVKWSSSNKNVAIVSKKGKVKGKMAGKATITAKAGRKKLKCKVIVKAKNTTEVSTPTKQEQVVTTSVDDVSI